MGAQYWQLTGNGTYQIQNTLDSTCLQVNSGSSTVVRATCNSQNTGQRWTFTTSGNGVRATNSLSSTCLNKGSGFIEVASCSSSSKSQRWSFYN